MSAFDNQMDEEDIRMESKKNIAWMLTFTDLVSLMLTFFVLLFSMSNIKVDRWNDVIDALSQSLNPSSTKAQSSATASFNIATLFRKRAINLDYLTSVLDEAVAKDDLLASSQLMRLEDRLVIALPGDLLFQPGKAVLAENARKALFNLGGVLRNIGNQIGINGHTDPAPPTGSDYTSNWELSMGRATAVANALMRAGYTEDIVAFGYADSRFKELPDMPAAERRTLGRRVDIVVFPTVGEF
jgi:chemotaxis protein MotB